MEIFLSILFGLYRHLFRPTPSHPSGVVLRSRQQNKVCPGHHIRHTSPRVRKRGRKSRTRKNMGEIHHQRLTLTGVHNLPLQHCTVIGRGILLLITSPLWTSDTSLRDDNFYTDVSVIRQSSGCRRQSLPTRGLCRCRWQVSRFTNNPRSQKTNLKHRYWGGDEWGKGGYRRPNLTKQSQLRTLGKQTLIKSPGNP